MKCNVSGPGRRWRPGFTLVELLVVVSVIGLLSGLMLPALAGAKAKAHGLMCLNNLRQWGLATQLYAGDHDDFLPPDGMPNPGEGTTNVGWYIQLPEALGLPRYHAMSWRTNAAVEPGRSVWICPANRRRSNGRNLFHYCLNEHVNGTGADNRPVRLASVPQPGLVIWLFDSKNLPAVGSWSYVHTNLHARGAQFVFLDGHAARFHHTAYWDFTVNRPRVNDPALAWIP
jgi:prepilin-type N-terminal cleavage/methylation domain-containing protein/prepilin-type processing-associated H-X9-DG protein